RLKQAIVGSHVEPSISTTHDYNVQCLHFEIAAIEIGDFQLTPCRRLDLGRDITGLLVIKVESRHSIAGSWRRRLLFAANCSLIRVELDNAIALRIGDVICKDAGSVCLLPSILKELDHVMPIEDVIAQYQGAGSTAKELPPNDKRLRQSV